MQGASPSPCILRNASCVAAMLLISFAAAHAQTRTLPAQSRFFVPLPPQGAVQQVEGLIRQHDLRDALLITAMETVPQAVWLTSGTPSEVSSTVETTLRQARFQRAILVLVLYNIPGRDCGSYSAGGAENTADYEAWIDAIAAAIGDEKAVILVEPDSLADLPSDCGYDPTLVDIPQATANRYTQISYAISALEARPQTMVYIDGGNSHWQAVPNMAARLVQAGVQSAQGFFTNVSNFNLNDYESKYDTWVSECIAFGQDAEQGGWRLGNYSYCASQYYSPLGTVDADNIATWVYTDEWFAQNMGSAVASTHFVVDTSRNGQGTLNASVYAQAPYNQPASVITTLTGGSWCNPPGRGLGTHPTAKTGVALLDAYLWVKTPGESDGTCDSAGGARAWDYADYSQPSWPTDTAGQAVFDPLWGLDDPIAGAWFTQQALDLAKRANPPLFQW